jgi:hypothetical protein
MDESDTATACPAELKHRGYVQVAWDKAIKQENNMSVITKDDTGAVRIVISDVEGWNGHEVHAGKHDANIMGTWVGKKWTELIMHAWSKQKTHRIHLTDEIATLKASEKNLKANEKILKGQIDMAVINARTWRANIDDLTAKLKESNLEVDRLKAAQSEDTANLNKIGELFAWFIARLGVKK